MDEHLSLLTLGMESFDRGVILLRNDSSVRLIGPRAQCLIDRHFGLTMKANTLPEALQAWVSQQEACYASSSDFYSVDATFDSLPGNGQLSVRYMRRRDNCLLLLAQRAAFRLRLMADFGLTNREVEVLHWVAEGKTNVEIAMILSLSQRTVSKHLEHIYQKIGVETRTAAAATALEAVRSSEG